jgi:hypothetical protein
LGAEGPNAVAAGGAVVEALIEDQLDAWITTYDLKITVVRPKSPTFLTDLDGREYGYVIDLSTMKIVWKGFGSYSSTTNSSAKQGLAELIKLLNP